MQHYSILLSCIFPRILVVPRLHKSCVFHLQPVSGIPEPTLTNENMKNEDKAEEGETSAVTGRVLSHGANIAESLRGAATRNAWDRSRLIIKTLHCNKPQFILFSIEACQLIIMRSTVIISKFHQGEPDIIEIIFSSLHEKNFCKVLTGY